MKTKQQPTKEKNFDAVGFVRTVRDKMATDMKGMTTTQMLEYIRKNSAWAKEKSVAG